MYDMDYRSLRIQAEDELRREITAAEVAHIKRLIRQQQAGARWWHRFIPFTIKIERRV